MPEIIVSNLNQKTISYNDQSATVLTVLHENFVDWMHACGGKGRCTTCKMIIIEGEKNISGESSFELKMKELGALSENERLACQCRLVGDITIKAPEENKLPHLTYSD